MNSSKSDFFTQQLVRILSPNQFFQVDTIVLHGSKVDGEQPDFWSDTDLIMVLSPQISIESEFIEKLISQHFTIIAEEIHQETHQIVCRYVIELVSKIELLDLTVYTFDGWQKEKDTFKGGYQLLFGDQNPTNNPVDYQSNTHPFDAQKLNQIWFLCFQCVKKLMRNDHLIGMHLLLDLLREYLVLAMIERDQKLQTNIHRFGNSEKLPTNLDISQLDLNNRVKVLEYIQSLAEAFVQKLEIHHPTLPQKLSVLKEYIQTSLEQLNNTKK